MKTKYKPRKTVQSLSRKVTAAIEQILDSERFKDYIATMARFHKYSFHNQMLISLQKPDATRVAGYVTWQKEFGRQVKKGAHSIAIFGHPQVSTREVEQEDETVEVEERRWWPVVHVFDISDTEGDPLPDLDRTKVPDNSPHAASLLKRLIQTVRAEGIGFSETGKAEGTLTNTNALGAYSPKKNTIELVTGNGASKGELFKTLVHEFSHALYSDRSHKGHSYALEECVVETAAMIVSSHSGLDIAPYDVSYVAYWSKGDQELYRKGLEKAARLASAIIDKLTTQRRN